MLGRRSRTIGAIALFGAAIGIALAATGARADVEDVLGAWLNVEEDDGRAAIERAILEGTEPLAPLRQRVARKRMFENNPPVHRLEVTREAGLVIARFNRGAENAYEYRAPLGGEAQANRGPDGRPVQVTHRVDEGGRFRVRMVAREGSGEAIYRLTGDRLTIEITIRSSHLPAPVRYVLRFRRAN